MFSQYFGNYLLNRGLVSPQQLHKALDYQANTRLKLGVLAINAGYMDYGQVNRVHEEQKKVDKRIGELAVEMGYLTEQQLEELLSTQKSSYLLLAQSLIDNDYLTMEQLETALNEYKKDHSLNSDQFKALQHDDIVAIIDTFVDLKESPHMSTYRDYLTLFLKHVIRFLDDVPVAQRCFVSEDFNANWYVKQEIRGDLNLTTVLSAEENEFLQLAGKYAGEQFDQLSELAKSSVAEFLNLHNGIFVVNVAETGIDADLKPQVVANALNTPTGIGKGLVIPLSISGAQFHLIMSSE